MNGTRKDLLKLLTVKTEIVKLECLKNTNFKDMEFQLREMTIAQNKEYREILSDESDDDRFDKSMKYSCSAVMVEPEFFTDDELESLGKEGEALMNEIFFKIPTIGMSAKEKKHFKKKMEESAKEIIGTCNSKLIDSYKNDKNIVDGLKADDLKILCEYLDIRYTNATDAKKALKSNKPLEDKKPKDEGAEEKK